MSAAPAILPFPTERLLVRRWREDDRRPFAALNADPLVMRHLGGPLTRAESDALVSRLEEGLTANGYGLAAVERTADGHLIGFVGLHHHRWYPQEVEIGWRLRTDAWGHGYASEAASAWCTRAFGALGLDRLISITTPDNARSLAVMRRLGMREWRRDRREGFDVVIHRLRAADWA